MIDVMASFSVGELVCIFKLGVYRICTRVNLYDLVM
jgi:hypothetical protein